MTPVLHNQFKTTFASFKTRSFRLLWIGNFFSNIGSWMQQVAQPWLVLSLSHSPFLLGLDAFASDAPLIGLILFGGVVADRKSRKKIIAISQVIQMSSAAVIALLLLIGHLHVWHIIFLSFVCGSAQAFSVPAFHATISSMVEERYIANAFALNSVQYNLSRIIGPILAGVTMASLGAVWCFGLNSISFLAFLAALYVVHIPFVRKSETLGSTPRPPLLSGVKAIADNPKLLPVLLTVVVCGFFAGPMLTFIPVFAKDVYHVGAKGFSESLGAFGAGAMLGALLIASMDGTVLSSKILAAFSGLLGISVVTLAINPSFHASLFILFFAGVGFLGSNAIANTMLQRSATAEFRGRAASVYMLALRGSFPLGNLMTGVVVTHFGVRRALLVNGLCCISGLTVILKGWVARKPQLAASGESAA